MEKEWGDFEEAAKVIQKGARYFFSIKDSIRMMKFVRSFGEKDEMRRFLNKKRCYDELISLEKEWGNINEAAKVMHEAAQYYFSIKDSIRMMKFVRSFGEKDEMRRFLNKRRCYDELISLEKEWGNINEASKVMHEAAQYYFSIKVFQSMMKFVSGFNEKGEMRSFLRNRRCFDELISLEKEWGNFEEAAKVTHEGAQYYFSIKDSESMMKLVRSFCDEDKMRSFLIERKCLDELILLEKEWGNFVEAAKIARLKPDPMLEAELLCMGGLYRESSLIILWHVFSNSPIFPNAEPPVTQKHILLKKALSIAKQDSDVFYTFVCQEAQLLSLGETEEELLVNGMEFIYCYKENAFNVSLEWVKTSQEIMKIKRNVTDMMRSFLKSANCQNKLLLLDEVCGEFIEAAKIGTEDELSIEAAFNRLWYVFFGSLWACGTRAWPLKDFKHKAELLDDVNAYVTDHPESQDSALMQTEIHVLSGEEISLSQMWRYLRETPKERSVRTQFLVSRRILEFHLRSYCSDYACIETQIEDETIKHLEDTLLENIVSVDGLVYFWNYWKEMICELVNGSHTGGQGCETSKLREDFIFNYFGIRKYNVNKYGGYVVLDAEAQWVKENRVNMIRNGYLYIIDACQLSSAALHYWCSELLFVADEVCEKLQSLHAYSSEKKLSIHQQIKILMCLLEVVKSVQNCEFLNSRKQAIQIVDRYFQPCVELINGIKEDCVVDAVVVAIENAAKCCDDQEDQDSEAPLLSK
ncbi:hypothetical protein QVD17_05198 [Tagetes erecta]|uniref:Uncharacterized protein n=1 Tax=Tagetes erecta TaxID=13708 RepID=A0AAD8PBB3_TARER|nr:hypothetical protein QVD17_05198 [Tagetes erecta]